MLRTAFEHLPDIERTRIPPTPDHFLRLHRKEFAEPHTPQLLAKIYHALQVDSSFHFYPDYQPFHDKVAEFTGVPPDQIVLGTGIEGLIRDLVMLTCDKGQDFAYLDPCCAMFGLYARIFGAHPIRLQFTPGKPQLIFDMSPVIGQNSRLVLLPNPGQPVETLFGLERMYELAEICRRRQCTLAIDEAYFGFGAPTCLPLVEAFENVVILRTMSKAMGGAALRVGWAIGKGPIVRALNGCRESGEVAGPSMTIASVMIDNWQSDILPGIRDVCEGRDWLRNQLTELGYQAYGQVSNHVLVDMETKVNAEAVVARLEQLECRVKGGFGPPIEQYVMVTCGSRQLMAEFLERFREAVGS